MCNYDGLSFTDGDGVIADGDFDVSWLAEFPAVLTEFELVEEPVVVLFSLIGLVDLLITLTSYFGGFVGSLSYNTKFNYYNTFIILSTL